MAIEKRAFWPLFATLVFSATVQAFTQMDFSNDLTSVFKVGWKFEGSDILIQIEKSRSGYSSFGLGTSMSNGDVFVIETTGSQLTVRDCRLVGQVDPNCDEPQDWTVVEKTLNSSGYKIELRRSAKTTDSNDKEYTASRIPIIYAYSDSATADDHSGRGSGFGTKYFDFGTGAVTTYSTLRLGDGTYMKHEHTQLLLWTVGTDILIPVGRYFRKYNRYFDGHSWPFLAILIASIVLRGNKSNTHKGQSITEAHEVMSVLVIILSALIALNGLILRGVMEFIKIPIAVKNITKLRLVHGALGVLTWIIARIVVFTGAVMHKDLYGPLVLGLVVAETIIFAIVILILDWLRWRQFKYPANKSFEEENLKSKVNGSAIVIIDDLKSGMPISELNKKYPDRNVFIFKNKVYDLGSYIHPGGQFIFQECRWREISRFMYGAVGLEMMNGDAWLHSTQAMEKLESSYIGDLLQLGPDGSDIVLRNEN